MEEEPSGDAMSGLYWTGGVQVGWTGRVGAKCSRDSQPGFGIEAAGSEEQCFSF